MTSNDSPTESGGNESVGEISWSDAAVLVGVLGHLQVIVDQDDPALIDPLLRRLRRDLVRYGLVQSDARDDLVAGIDELIVRIRKRALHEQWPEHDS